MTQFYFSDEWNEILGQVGSFMQHDSSVIWFRGERNANTPLHSGLLKSVEKKGTLDVRRVQEVENDAYHNFISYGASLHTETGFGQLVLMQHHGIPTRLLDWSESFEVALFFAVWRWQNSDGNARIWMLHPTRLNHHLSGNHGMYTITKNEKYEDIINSEEDYAKQQTWAVALPQRNDRIIAQKGRFTLQGLSLQSLEEENDGILVKKKALSFVDLPETVMQDAKMYLHMNGVNEFTMFPDIDGLANLIKRRLNL